MVDWNLSRSRYWGTPLPIWKTKDGKEEICIGSVDELINEMHKAKEWNSETLIEKIKTDLHKPFVDDIILKSASGQQMFREPDLIDVWFDSGAMPYAQWHYPFANKNIFKNNFPADYICEGVDQTRGWFYTLHALAVMLFDSVAFKTVVSNGLVLDKNGNKMSKRLGNVINPFETIDKYGADATRWYLITNASPWDNMKFDITGIQEVQRKFFGTLYNTYQFFALYANVDGFTFKEKYIPIKERPEIDQWILSTLNTLVQDVTHFMDAYEATEAYRKIEYFLDEQLSNWYVRLCRRRFWKGEYEQDKIAAYQTLYECLDMIAQLIAPIAPFFAEWLFNNLNQTTQKYKVASVHHSLFPKANDSYINTALEEKMAMAQITSSLVLSLRKASNIKVRQPLQKILIPVFDSNTKNYITSVQDIILAETNIKHIEFINPNDGFIQKTIKPNFILLGKKLGAKMKAVSDALSNFSQAQIQTIEQKKCIDIVIQNETITLLLEEVEIKAKDIPGWMVANKDNITVALDITVTPDLENEGNAREFVNRIQKIRKEQNFNLTDKIHVLIEPNTSIEKSLLQFKPYICTELLATDLSFTTPIENVFEIDVNEVMVKVGVRVV